MYTNQVQKHKTFISFYHYDDQNYKNYLDRCFRGTEINKSVNDGEYNPDNSDDYIKRLIREEKISDSSVIVVLVGPNTRKRKHVDWEIFAGLEQRIKGNSGLVGVLLPEFPMTSGNSYRLEDLPGRLADNVKSGYADMYTWDVFINNYFAIVDDAFQNRIKRRNKIDNSRLQMQRNLGYNE